MTCLDLLGSILVHDMDRDDDGANYHCNDCTGDDGPKPHRTLALLALAGCKSVVIDVNDLWCLWLSLAEPLHLVVDLRLVLWWEVRRDWPGGCALVDVGGSMSASALLKVG